jgi:hypothetical protein
MVVRVSQPGVSVSEAIEVLRSELEAAFLSGSGRAVRFAVPEAVVTLSVVATREAGADARVRWWVVDGGGSASWTREQTQTLQLTLRPQRVLPDGSAEDLTVGASDTEGGV